MKRTLLGAVLVAGAMILSVPAAQAQGATVVKQFGCLLSAQDSGLGVNLFTSNPTIAVVTPSGNTMLSCHFDIPDGEEPASAIRNLDFPCGTFLGLTDNSQSVVNPGGKAVLKCWINPSS